MEFFQWQLFHSSFYQVCYMYLVVLERILVRKLISLFLVKKNTRTFASFKVWDFMLYQQLCAKAVDSEITEEFGREINTRRFI